MPFNHVEKTGTANKSAIGKVPNCERNSAASLLLGECLIEPEIEYFAASNFDRVPPNAFVVPGFAKRLAMGGLKRFELNPATDQKLSLERHVEVPPRQT